MHCRRSWPVGGIIAAVALALIAGCGGNGGGGSTPPQEPGLVSGLLVVHRDVGAGEGDALGAVPPEAEGAVGEEFDRTLAHADWTIDGGELRGVTGPDGRFEIAGLPPGRHLMRVSKTVGGNLVVVEVPVVVGEDGSAEVVAEVAWGRVKATSTYRDGGDEIRDTSAPNGTRLVTRSGQVIELADRQRTLIDADGDGWFEVGNCSYEIWSCGEDRDCGPDRACSCTASCPRCKDCGPPVCVLPGAFPPYRCTDDGDCALPGDRCVCVGSCEGCDDCLFGVCVPTCEPAEIEAIAVSAPAQLVAGQSGSAAAFAELSDGTAMEITWLAEWMSSDEAVATVDSWGTIAARGVGFANLTATLAEVSSAAWRIEVVDRPALRRIYVQNLDCVYRFASQIDGLPEEVLPSPDVDKGILAPPECGQVILVGSTIQFAALGEFEGGYYEDLTDEVEWQVSPADVGDVVNGLFTARQPGTARLRAVLGEVASEDVELRAVSERMVVSLSIYPENMPYFFFDDLPGLFDEMPCFDCGFNLTLLSGDEVQFRATAHYDTGEWEDVTDEVTWSSSEPVVGAIDAGGLLSVLAEGETIVGAVLDGAESGPFGVRVVEEATLLSLHVYQEGRDRAIGKGDQAFFRAMGYYDVGFSRDVTDDAAWLSSDETVGGFDEAGVFIGRAAGTATVWAELEGQESESLQIEVFETSDIDYCDPDNVNRGTWTDDFNRVVLESDCAEYAPPAVVTLRFTVTESQRPGGIFDPCLDLFAYRGDELVRTIREEGCGDPFLARDAPEFDEEVLRYQLRAFWDLKDESGEIVPQGTYTIYGRFYLYYDPVVSIDITVR